MNLLNNRSLPILLYYRVFYHFELLTTQEYIANAADVNTSHISNIENNRVKVSLSVLVQICNALDTTVDYILSDEYNDSSSAIEQEILHELHSCNNETKEQILKIVKALQ